MTDTTSIAQWLQLGFAVAVAWYLLTKAMPRMEERAKDRDERFLDAINSLEDRHEEREERAQQMFAEELREMRGALERLPCSTVPAGRKNGGAQ